MGKCPKCGETRIIQDEATDLGYRFLVFGCYTQIKCYFPDRIELINQGNLCKDRQIAALEERLAAWREWEKTIDTLESHWGNKERQRLHDLGEL